MEFENIDKKLQIKLLNICKQDTYNLNPKTLYKNILYSTGNHQILAKIFDVPIEIIKEIKEPSSWWFFNLFNK